MATKTKKTARAKAQSAKKNLKSRTKPPDEAASRQTQGPAQERFVKDLLVRGDAAELDPEGKLPLHATHIIDKENKDGTATVRRARFKLF